MEQKQVTIYSTPTCHFCHMAKEYFTANNIAFTDHDVAADAEQRNIMMEKSGQRGVPVIYIGDEMIIGFDKKAIDAALGLGA
jgi:glutaredoxin-like YruB-family protein